MNFEIEQFNKLFENRIRLVVMSVLITRNGVDFKTLKELLNLSDGNLVSHIAMLESAGYIEITKCFLGKKTQTTYTPTPKGMAAFAEHLAALQKFLRANAKTTRAKS